MSDKERKELYAKNRTRNETLYREMPPRKKLRKEMVVVSGIRKVNDTLSVLYTTFRRIHRTRRNK